MTYHKFDILSEVCDTVYADPHELAQNMKYEDNGGKHQFLPAAGEGILTPLFCVSLVCLLKGNCVQDMSL